MQLYLSGRASCLLSKRNRYLTVVADLDQSRVLYLADDRRQESLDGFWPALTDAQQAGIQAVAMDMWEPYVQSTRAALPEAGHKIVFVTPSTSRRLSTSTAEAWISNPHERR